MRVIFFALAMYLVIVMFPAAASCQEESNWDFELAPFYLWAISIDGDMGIRGRTSTVGVEFSDVWDNLQGVVTVRFSTLYRKKFGFLFDYNYLDLGSEQLTQAGDIDVSFKSQIVNLGGTYRFLDGQHSIDGLAGIRYTKLEAGLELKDLGVNIDGDQDWVDPIVGLRYAYQISDMWSLRLYGDIGGFGAASDFTWQGLGLISLQPWKNVAFVAGYRGIGTDYETGSGSNKFTYDTTVHGPIIGLDISW